MVDGFDAYSSVIRSHSNLVQLYDHESGRINVCDVFRASMRIGGYEKTWEETRLFDEGFVPQYFRLYVTPHLLSLYLLEVKPDPQARFYEPMITGDPLHSAEFLSPSELEHSLQGAANAVNRYMGTLYQIRINQINENRENN